MERDFIPYAWSTILILSNSKFVAIQLLPLRGEKKFTLQEITKIPGGLKNLTKGPMYFVWVRNAVHRHSAEHASFRNLLVWNDLMLCLQNLILSLLKLIRYIMPISNSVVEMGIFLHKQSWRDYRNLLHISSEAVFHGGFSSASRVLWA